jgi:hypothetical protein
VDEDEEKADEAMEEAATIIFEEDADIVISEDDADIVISEDDADIAISEEVSNIISDSEDEAELKLGPTPADRREEHQEMVELEELLEMEQDEVEEVFPLEVEEVEDLTAAQESQQGTSPPRGEWRLEATFTTLVCPVCEAAVTMEGLDCMAAHMARHPGWGDAMLPCRRCGRHGLVSAAYIPRHMETRHGATLATGGSFPSASDLGSSPSVRRDQDGCDYVYMDEEALRNHRVDVQKSQSPVRMPVPGLRRRVVREKLGSPEVLGEELKVMEGEGWAQRARSQGPG